MSEREQDDSVLMSIGITTDNWATLAAIAWAGYQAVGRGVVLTDASRMSHDGCKSTSENFPTCYVSAASGVIRRHSAQLPELEAWLKEYDPKQSVILGFAFSFCVYYCALDALSGFLRPAEAHEEFREQVKDALDEEQCPVLKEWPQVSFTAKVDASGGTIQIEFSAPSKTEIRDGFERLTEWLKGSILREIRQSTAPALNRERMDRIAFEKRLAVRWKESIDLFETVLIACREAGSEFNKKHREAAAIAGDTVFDALTRLHARACVIASEVLALLKSGHADGAQTRWRALHETSVIASFIAQSEAEVATRYLRHEIVESYRAMSEYQRHAPRLGLESFDEHEAEDLKGAYDRLLTEYGPNFSETYGWASIKLRSIYTKQTGRFTFAQLEKATKKDHWRPFYRMASHWVHAGPKSLKVSLGLKDCNRVLLAGVSNTGLADPGQCTCISLMQITTTLLTLRTELDTAATVKALIELADEASNSFIHVQANLDREIDQQEKEAEVRQSVGMERDVIDAEEEDGLKSFEGFSRMEEAATFFLYESFGYAHKVAEYQVAGLLFAERIETIEPAPDWKMPSLPKSFYDWLTSSDSLQVLDEGTLNRLALAWQSAQADAPASRRKLSGTLRSQSIDLVGCVINLAACVEAVTNRHLFFLVETGELDPGDYSSLDRTSVMAKLLFAFKDEIASKRLSTKRLKQLFRLRNRAVHFKASTANSISLSFKDLLAIWREVGSLFGRVRGEPTEIQIACLSREFASKWLED